MPEPQVSPQQARRRPPAEPQPGTEEQGDGAAPAAPDPASPAAPPANNLTRLREQYEQSGEERRTTIPIAPGRFNGNLAARYHPVPWTDTRKAARRAAKGGFSEDAELNYAAGQLAKACTEILIRLEDGGDFVPLHRANEAWAQQGPVRYDSRLCEVLGIELAAGLSPAAIVRLVFKHPHALNAHYTEFDAWLKEVTEADEDEEPEALQDRPT